jgi:hypothetical protein
MNLVLPPQRHVSLSLRTLSQPLCFLRPRGLDSRRNYEAGFHIPEAR